MMMVKSLKSLGCLNEVYNWGWSYYFLTNKGVSFLINELGLPVDSKIVPATHAKKRVKVVAADVKEGKEGEEDQSPENQEIEEIEYISDKSLDDEQEEDIERLTKFPHLFIADDIVRK